MSALRRICEHFVVPADLDPPAGGPGSTEEPPGPDRRDSSCGPPSVAVLAPAANAPALAAGLGLALAERRRAPALVCLWSTAPQRTAWRAPALPAARRLAATLRGRGHAARGCGRLVLLTLPVAADEAAIAARRASAAAAESPVVLALGGPRLAAFDALLEAQDLVVVAPAHDAGPGLGRLALEGLDHAPACELPWADSGRSLALAGVVLLPSARRALAAPVAALP